MERLVEPLKSTCTMKVRANSVKQEYEKQDELKRSALRAVAALLTIPDAGKIYKASLIKNFYELRLSLLVDLLIVSSIFRQKSIVK